MNYLDRKGQRILFILGSIFAVYILIKSIIWVVQPGNSLYKKSFIIPNEIELILNGYKHNSVIELRSKCNWKRSSDFNLTKVQESVVISRDTQYAINSQCLFGNSGPSIIGPERCNNLLNEYFNNRDQFMSDGSSMEVSCEQLYIKHAMSFSPLFQKPFKEVDFNEEKIGKCLLKNDLVCVESNKEIKFRLWEIIKSDKLLLVTLAAFIICLIGVIFFSAIIKIWQMTFVKLISWIKEGR